VASEDDVDRTRVRVGLVVVTVTFVIALTGLLLIDNGFAKAVMGLVMFTAVVRAFLLTRSIRR
jgi:hypothetical protein